MGISTDLPWYETMTAPMGSSSSAGLEQWVFATGQFPRAHFGKNGIAERLIGTLRRECLDQMLVFLAKRTCGEFSPPMRRTTIKRARTWRYGRMRLYIGRCSETEPLSPYQFCRVFIIGTRGYDFRKGQRVSNKY